MKKQKPNRLRELLGREPTEGNLIDKIRSEKVVSPSNRKCPRCNTRVLIGIFPSCKCNVPTVEDPEDPNSQNS
jgi:hypothetical protein